MSSESLSTTLNTTRPTRYKNVIQLCRWSTSSSHGSGVASLHGQRH